MQFLSLSSAAQKDNNQNTVTEVCFGSVTAPEPCFWGKGGGTVPETFSNFAIQRKTAGCDILAQALFCYYYA